MSDDRKQKTLSYRRAAWLTDDRPASLEECLVRAHAALPSTAARTFSYGRGQIQGAKFRHRPGVGFFLHVSQFVPDQHAAVVAKPSASTEGAVRTLPPPATDDYVDGDVMAMVSGDHLVFCPHHAHESVLGRYVERCLLACGYEDPRGMVSLQKIADGDKLDLLRQEGVSSIELNASMYDASVDYTERHAAEQDRRTIGKTLVGGFVRQFLALFEQDPDPELREIHERENLQVRLSISYDSRKRGGEIGRKRIEQAAGRVVDEAEDEGFIIVTGKGKKVTAREVRLSTRKEVRVYGNSIGVADAWEKLEEYFTELACGGWLER